MKSIRIIMMLMLVGILAAGCSQEADLTAPDTQGSIDKDGTEELGAPSVSVADGSGFLECGVGMVDTDTGNFDITVPAGATVVQVLLYWEGGTTSDDGDHTISINGTSVTGTEIGGPTNFFENYDFYAYRADITGLDMVVTGLNNFEITDFDFDFSGNDLDENNGAGILVIYDDGSEADLSLFDGLDLAFFNFAGVLNSTVPKTFTFNAEDADRVADLVVFAGSVGENRPNQIKVTTSAGDQIFDNVLGSDEGPLWDSHVIQVNVPGGATELTVELISVPSSTPLGASMAWVGTGLSVPVTPVQDGCTLTIGFWKNHAGFGPQDDVLSQYLHITLGDDGGDKSLVVTSAAIAVDVLKQKTYGRPNNGITKMYAQLLAAKLNYAAGASDIDVADYVSDADAFLADHDHDDWNSLSNDEKDMVRMWHGAFDDYNNGDIGPGHCDDRDDDDDHDRARKMFN